MSGMCSVALDFEECTKINEGAASAFTKFEFFLARARDGTLNNQVSEEGKGYRLNF